MKQDLHGYRPLRAGNLSLLYNQGEIRQVRVGNIQVINAIYAAVRDRNWETVPIRFREESVTMQKDSFRLDISFQHEANGISFEAEIQIRASPQKLSFGYRGKALCSFLKNRIGICVLHPTDTSKGQSIAILHPDGSTSEGHFPKQIRPDQPVMNLAGMRWKAAGQLDAELRFKGDIFEMEDQRNWTDASFKTYSTPLAMPFPVEIQEGDVIEQSVHLRIVPSQAAYMPASKQGIELKLHVDRPSPIPSIGAMSTSDGDPLSAKEAFLLKRISFHHIRTDLTLGDPAWKQAYERAWAEQDLLEWPVELGLHFRRDYREELEGFLQLQAEKDMKLARILVFNRERMTDKSLLEQVVPRLRNAMPQVPVGGGTDAYFAELNRNRPDPAELDFVTYSICPQVHAFDELTLVENLQAQGDTVDSARQLFGKPVHIGAVTLKQRFNMVATDEGDQSPPYPLADPRQATVFAAGWTLGSIRQLSGAGAASVNYFECAGIRGMMDRRKETDGIYPVFYLLEEILKKKNIMFEVSCSDPYSVEAMVLRNGRTNTLLLVNLTDKEQHMELDALQGKSFQMEILADSGWKAIPADSLQLLPMNAASMYKILWQS